MLTNSALQSSAHTISDMYGDSEKYMNLKFPFEKYMINGKKFSSGCTSAECTDWSINAWYISPNQTEITEKDPEYLEYKLCGYS